MAFLTTVLHCTLSVAVFFQFLTPKLAISTWTSSIHRLLGLPLRLLPSILAFIIILGNGLTCRNKFLMGDTFVVEKDDQQSFDLGFLQTTLLLVAGKSVNTTPSIAV